jgi:hypothetical protein
MVGMLALLAVTCQVKMSFRHLHAFSLAKLTRDSGDQRSVELDHLTTPTTCEMVVRLLLHSLVVAMPLT